jgi:hypothetical protein
MAVVAVPALDHPGVPAIVPAEEVRQLLDEPLADRGRAAVLELDPQHFLLRNVVDVLYPWASDHDVSPAFSLYGRAPRRYAAPAADKLSPGANAGH